ncbi:hypothetical protein LJR016_002282 [Devosia sp. LjRoot16]|uniref:DUF6634 family protein n=1 Tax=Devosia sp. LjRoot16 TaxID=3342271 RepID=UPI003ECF5EAA
MSIIYPCGVDPAAAVRYLRALADDLEAMTVFAPREELEDAPRLENWKFATRPVAALEGTVIGHPLLGDHRQVVTSEVYALDGSAGWVRTLSRFYALGARANDQEMN